MKEMTQDLTITQAFLHNLVEIQAIARITFSESFARYNTPSDLQLYLEHNLGQARLKLELVSANSTFYLVKKRAETIGYLKVNHALPKEADHKENGMELERIYILRQYQGQGIGQLLFDFVKSLAVESDARYLWLGVWEHNERAIKFYESNHMQRFGTHTFVLGKDEQTDILMKLDV